MTAMIKQLNGLKVEAIAVKVPDFEKAKWALFGKYLCASMHGFGWSSELDLPLGEWAILGRASELLLGEVTDKLGLPQWMNCVESNNLTNELILINPLKSNL